MAHLFNRRVLLAVCGGIAAYKSAELVRALTEQGAQVRVLMTRGAREFITPLTLQALSGHPVHGELLDEAAERGMGHIELARWADLLLIAPATADCLARLAAGRADDLLGAVALASAAPLLLAPAMNQQMWRARATQDNLARLVDRGYHCVGPDSGDQACGDVGPGRMSEPVAIAAAAAGLFAGGFLDNLRVTVTAGPTREPLDPVRYLTNHSSGRMGFALARAAAEAGAAVTLIAGPVQLATPERVQRIDVTTADEMLAAALAQRPACDMFLACAAVADYRPADSAAQKIKKSGQRLSLELVAEPGHRGRDHRCRGCAVHGRLRGGDRAPARARPRQAGAQASADDRREPRRRTRGWIRQRGQRGAAALGRRGARHSPVQQGHAGTHRPGTGRGPVYAQGRGLSAMRAFPSAAAGTMMQPGRARSAGSAPGEMPAAAHGEPW
jgi:phosphopantothenoylcysteine decarboxylase/phosphopantothenate--cysteine ligase